MVGSTGKRYGEEFKLMILEMHKKGKTIRELSNIIFNDERSKRSKYVYWVRHKYNDEIQSLKVELSEKDRQIKDQAEEIEILKKVYAILMKK